MRDRPERRRRYEEDSMMQGPLLLPAAAPAPVLLLPALAIASRPVQQPLNWHAIGMFFVLC